MEIMVVSYVLCIQIPFTPLIVANIIVSYIGRVYANCCYMENADIGKLRAVDFDLCGQRQVSGFPLHQPLASKVRGLVLHDVLFDGLKLELFSIVSWIYVLSVVILRPC